MSSKADGDGGGTESILSPLSSLQTIPYATLQQELDIRDLRELEVSLLECV